MRKILVAAAFGAMLSMSIGAYAAPYASFSAGFFQPANTTVTDDYSTDEVTLSYKTGGVVSGAVGYRFDNGLRLEEELSYRGADFDKASLAGYNDVDINSKFTAVAFMTNLFYDIKTESIVSPYFGVGLGTCTVKVDDATFSSGGYSTPGWYEDDQTVLAYQLGVGLGFNVSQNVTFDVGYRFFGTEDIQFTDYKSTFSSHAGTVGVRFIF